MYSFSLGIISFLLLYVNAWKNYCNVPSGRVGVCVLISECKFMMELVNDAEKNLFSTQYNNTIEYRRSFICGYEGTNPKVCCEQPNPPNVLFHPNLRLLDHGSISCGVFDRNKIVGGNKTGIFEFPWMALLVYQVDNDRRTEFQCGGTIINKRYILTAAHCVTGFTFPFKIIGVRVGDHDISTNVDCDNYFNPETQKYEKECAEGFQEIAIEMIHIHYEYSTVTLQNDIALIRLNRDINFLPRNVKPICLPVGTAAEFYGGTGFVTGWGATERGPQSSKLLKARVPLVNITDCQAKYPRQNIIYKQMCAGGQTGLDSCTGDSGGPLQNPGKYSAKSRFVQYGIISYGTTNCGTLGYPGIYTTVSYYMDWILSNMRM